MPCGASLAAPLPDVPLPDGRPPMVKGAGLDARTRCRHYAGALDIVAIRFACCGDYYACHLCHEELADHPPARWAADRFEWPAVLCGACGRELTVNEYLSCGNRCTGCGARFNPDCARHRHLYFQVDPSP